MQVSLGAVNSINWARVLAQITYYFHAYFQVTNKLPGRRDKVSQLGASLVWREGEGGEGGYCDLQQMNQLPFTTPVT